MSSEAIAQLPPDFAALHPGYLLRRSLDAAQRNPGFYFPDSPSAWNPSPNPSKESGTEIG